MDYSKTPTDTLEKLCIAVTKDLISINQQIDSAKSAAASSGVYSDPDWFNRLRHAARQKGRTHQSLLVELGKRRKDERRAINNMKERRFVEAARRRLDRELFVDLWAEANDEAAISDKEAAC